MQGKNAKYNKNNFFILENSFKKVLVFYVPTMQKIKDLKYHKNIENVTIIRKFRKKILSTEYKYWYNKNLEKRWSYYKF